MYIYIRITLYLYYKYSIKKEMRELLIIEYNFQPVKDFPL